MQVKAKTARAVQAEKENTQELLKAEVDKLSENASYISELLAVPLTATCVAAKRDEIVGDRGAERFNSHPDQLHNEGNVVGVHGSATDSARGSAEQDLIRLSPLPAFNSS
eukprot:scaffold1027_cov413-Prasinococcus_capsulatus_cf.AAC.9